jgi:hypothetical protein
MLGLAVIVLGLAIVYFWQTWHDHQYLDGRTFPNGQTHQFVIGDNLRLYGGGQGGF